MKKLGLLACVLSSAQAVAADWQQIGSTWDGGSVYMDRESVTSLGGAYKKAWFKLVYLKEQLLDASKKDDVRYIQALSLNHFDCGARRSAALQSIYHSKAGEVVWSFSIPSMSATYNEIAPETVGELMLTAACKPTQSWRDDPIVKPKFVPDATG